jgi:hypothetical protein
MKLTNIIQCATIALPLILADSNPAPIFAFALLASTNLKDITSSLSPSGPQEVCLNEDRKTVKMDCKDLEKFQGVGAIQLDQPSKEPTQVEINWPGNTRYVSTRHSMQGQN